MKLWLVNMLCLLSVCALGQATTKTFDIQEISIQDTFLLKQIGNFIDEQLSEDENFKRGLGYVVVDEKNCFQTGDTLHAYFIFDEYFSLDKNDPENLFPVCYAWVKDRLVFFESDIISPTLVRYSRKSKRKLRKKLEPFLPPAEHLLVKDEQSNIIIDDPTFRPDELVTLDGVGKLIYIFRDRPPEVKKSQGF